PSASPLVEESQSIGCLRRAAGSPRRRARPPRERRRGAGVGPPSTSELADSALGGRLLPGGRLLRCRLLPGGRLLRRRLPGCRLLPGGRLLRRRLPPGGRLLRRRLPGCRLLPGGRLLPGRLLGGWHVHLLPAVKTPCASGVVVPARSSRPTRRSARRASGRSSGTRCERGNPRRCASPLARTRPSRERRSRDRTRDSGPGLAMERRGAPFPPRITFL